MADLQSRGVADKCCLCGLPVALDHAQQQRQAARPGRVCVWTCLDIHRPHMPLRILLQCGKTSSELCTMIQTLQLPLYPGMSVQARVWPSL